jgi:hypothetical protein
MISASISLKNLKILWSKVAKKYYMCLRSFANFHPGVDFIKVLLAAFTRADHKSIKIQSSRQHLFALLGSAIYGRFILSIL